MTDEQLRESFSDIPSDLPRNVPKHPGKTIDHRFVAEKVPSQIITSSVENTRKLASEVNFSPVTTLNIADRQVHVKPVNNVRARVISPPKLGALQLLVRGEKVIADSTEIQDQTQNQRDQKIEKFFAKAEPIAPRSVTPQPETKQPPRTPALTQQKIVPPLPTKRVNDKPPLTFATSPVGTEGKTDPGKGQLKTEVSTLRQLLNQSDVDKTVSQRRVVELTDKYQSQLAATIQEKTQINSQLTDLRRKLVEETKRRMASENSSVAATNQLKTEINKMKIERDGQLGKLKEVQDKTVLMQGQLAKATESSVIITQLKAKNAQIEREKDLGDRKVIKLEALVSDLQNKSDPPVEAKELIIPKEADSKSKDVPVKIVHPAPAIGKMAPQLTTVPNVVNGIIKNRDGLLLSNVVLVVKDSVGNSVRALKSNKIGQFAISTPLPNGVYTMELEKDNNEFNIVQINLEGKILLPIEIRAV